MWQTDNWTANFIIKTLRSMFAVLDLAVYSLLIIVYQVFFNVASAQIIEGATIKSFFGRIQIILGVFVLFKLAINLINVIVNPDQLSNDKSGQGFSQIVVRVICALIMLVAIMPLNIPGTIKEGSYEANLNANGLLFGTMYEIQDRVLEQNVLAKLIIGSTKTTGKEERNTLKDTGNQLASFILKGFVRINLKPGQSDEYESKNWMCPDNEEDVKKYLNANLTPSDVLDLVTLNCKTSDGKRFVFTYMTPFTTIVGIIFIIILVGFVIDVAMRAFKLAILRLIAPIPIISYIDPKSSKDGAFASWVKTVVSTYLQLFLHLAVIFFVIYIIQDIMINGLNIDNAGGGVGAISWIFIILGLLYFAKQAPKFISNALGIKSMGLGVGLSGALGFLGGVTAGGGVGGAMTAAMTAANTANEAAAQGKAAPNAYSTGRDLVTKMKIGDDKAVGGFLNNAQRHMMQHSKQAIGARQLQKKFGITEMESERAKGLMYQAQDEASNMAAMRSRFDVGAGQDYTMLSQSDRAMWDRYVSTHGREDEVKEWQAAMRSGNATRIRAASTALMDHMVNKTQTEFQKQKKTYEDSDALLKKYGNDLPLEQKYATGVNRYTAKARNAAAQGMQHIPGFKTTGERMENGGKGNGGWNRYFADQGRSMPDQEFKKYGDKNKKWNDRTR